MAANTRLCGVILLPPMTLPQEFHTLVVRPDKTIQFLAVFPLYPEEMDLKLKRGAQALFPGFDRNQTSELLQIDRPSAADKPPRKKLFGLF